ncbi:MAG: hypothetical protein HY023_19030 [Chloroflexi bacterium]|nr:hypothetical protein [Chloroflexota bacterium]MBI3762328.1 hypothetical protein [Chloroflexota bacterium]
MCPASRRLAAKPPAWLERLTGPSSLVSICAVIVCVVGLTTLIFLIVSALRRPKPGK